MKNNNIPESENKEVQQSIWYSIIALWFFILGTGVYSFEDTTNSTSGLISAALFIISVVAIFKYKKLI